MLVPAIGLVWLALACAYLPLCVSDWGTHCRVYLSYLPSSRGLFSGGLEPSAHESGTNAATPAPPPDHPSIAESHSMP
jgi:hypothetical protein